MMMRARSTTAFRTFRLRPLLLVLLWALSLPTGAIDSMSNKVTSIQTSTDGSLLIVGVATGIYHTIGINPACPFDKSVAIRLDAVTQVELIEEELIMQAVDAARRGPFRIQFSIVQDECVQRPGATDSLPIPVATGVKLIQTKLP